MSKTGGLGFAIGVTVAVECCLRRSSAVVGMPFPARGDLGGDGACGNALLRPIASIIAVDCDRSGPGKSKSAPARVASFNSQLFTVSLLFFRLESTAAQVSRAGLVILSANRV